MKLENPILNPPAPPLEISDYGSVKITRKQGIIFNCVEVDDDYTARSNDKFIFVNQASGTKTVTLPLGEEGKEYVIKALTANQVDVTGTNSELIDGSATESITTQYYWVRVVFYNGAWHQV